MGSRQGHAQRRIVHKVCQEFRVAATIAFERAFYKAPSFEAARLHCSCDIGNHLLMHLTGRAAERAATSAPIKKGWAKATCTT